MVPRKTVPDVQVSGETPSPRPFTVLLVEDEVLIRMDLAEEMRLAGWEVLEAANADEALALLRSVPAIDVLVTDVNMPGERNGLDLAMLVSEQMPDVKIAIMSGHSVVTSEVKWAGLFFSKPVLPSNLIAGLKDLAKGDRTES